MQQREGKRAGREESGRKGVIKKTKRKREERTIAEREGKE